jgi:hypothetical protein
MGSYISYVYNFGNTCSFELDDEDHQEAVELFIDTELEHDFQKSFSSNKKWINARKKENS